jgi:hypothetical protein
MILDVVSLGVAASLVPMIDINPVDDVGEAISDAVTDQVTRLMLSLWQAGLWLLDLTFGLLDRFLTPDLTDPGLTAIYGVCLWISLLMAILIGLGQIGLAAIRRDGAGLARVAVGVAQYGAVIACWVAVCAGLVWATTGLTHGILDATLDVRGFGEFSATASWPTEVGSATAATVLGLSSLLLLVPAALGYVVIMLVREAALLVLVITLPISAAGVLSEATRSWLWKAVRWFVASCLIAPLVALILGVGVAIAQSAFPDGAAAQGPADPYRLVHGDPQALEQVQQASESAVGMAVVGCVVIVIACFSPMVLFRLLAFVDPGTGSGAAMRASLAANGGLSGLLSGARPGVGPASASRAGSDGQSAGEDTADTLTERRFPAAVGTVSRPVGAAMGVLGAVGQRATALGVDVMGGAGVGTQTHYDATPAGRRTPPTRTPVPADTHGLSDGAADEPRPVRPAATALEEGVIPP